MKLRTLSLTLLLAGMLGGCVNLAPDYARPAAPVESTWPATGGKAVETTDDGRSAAAIGWQDFFVDARLRQLIELSLANNRDLRATAQAIVKARATYRIQQAELLPALSADAGTTARRTPADLAGGQAVTSRTHSVALGVSGWEVDLFGRLQNLRDQALQQYLASEDTLRSTRISLIAEVAGAYLTLSADEALLALARDTLASQEASQGLIRKRVEVGIGTELDLRQIETSVETARRDVATYTAQVAADRNALVLLAGGPVPDSLLPPPGLDSVTALGELPVGLPSEVLRQRPDVLAAERQLVGAHASIGAARAAFFPSISLTATAGTASGSLSGLFAGGSGAWTFIPQVSLPIFNAGANQASLDAAKADREIYLARYESAIQTAFREVADALAQRATIDDRVAAQRKLTEATAASYRLSEARYLKGVDSYLSTLDAQRALYAARQSLVSLRLAAATNAVTLYKVLGGGDSATPAPRG